MGKIKEINVNLKELEKEKERNFEERLKFIDYWTDYMKRNKDNSWSVQQNVLINGQIKKP
ncbi:MAG: hypothetical protein NUV46_01000 [Nanoarchaeota archaeon]|nr:hypothetical protein [Nanoarchaeota archaeon]